MNRKVLKNFWKKKKAATCLFMAVCLAILSSCGTPSTPQVSGETVSGTESPGEDGSSAAKGRYMESPKTTPEGLSNLENMVRLADGSLGIVDQDSGTVYISGDEGESWESKDLEPLINVLNQDGAEVTSLAMAADGGIFFSYVLWNSDAVDENGNVTEQCMYVDASGQGRDISVESKLEDYILRGSVFGEDGNLYLVYLSGQVYQVDLETGSLADVMKISGDPMVFTASGDCIICADSDEVNIYRTSTGEKLEPDSVFNAFVSKELAAVYQMGILVDSGEGQIYTASKSGLYSHVPGGSVMDELLEGGLSNMGDPTRKAVSLLKGKEEGFLVAYNDGEIDSYIYDKDAPAVPEQQLTVYSLLENDTVSKAVSSFRKNHPEVFVKQEIGISDEQSMVAEDAIRNLNASLLSGEGPDIMILDGMPKDSYMEKGQLKDLSGFVEKLKGQGDYFWNILTAYQNEDGIYALPTRFQIPVAIGEKQAVEKMKTLEDLADAVEADREKNPGQRTILGTYAPDELLAILQAASAPAWIEKGEFKKDAVLSYLTQAQKIYEAEHKNITPEQEQLRVQYTTTTEFGMSYAEYNAMINAAAAFNILAGESSFIVGNLNSSASVKMLVSLMDSVDTLDYAAMPGQAENVFCPKGIVGINAGTKEEDLSYDFLEELFSGQVLKNDLGDGYPVNQKAFDQFFVDPSGGTNQEGFAASSEDGVRVDFMIHWPSDQELNRVKEMIGTLTLPGDVESMLKEAVFATGEKVLKGDLTPQEGADEIGQKMELYFAE
ncbi:MAG: hypothetical protein NC307_12055 [Roseburia sp.]|nr:hypothetical protein [Roseburia sp.]